VKDLIAKKLVMIGDPATRYREDPVRMAARGAPVGEARPLDRAPDGRRPSPPQAPPGERAAGAPLRGVLKMLLSGNAVACVQRLRELELHHGLLPLLDDALEDPATGPFAMAASRRPTTRLREDKPVSPAFLLPRSCGPRGAGWHELEEKGHPPRPRCIRPCTTRSTRSAGRSPSRAASTPR